MPDDLSKKTCCVVDNGLFVEVASRLTRDFKEVYYYSPYKSSYPKLSDSMIGEGLPGVTRVYDLWDIEDKIDLWYFADVNDGDLQSFLRREGRRVWGSGDAQFLELDRWQARQLQIKLGLPAPGTRRIIGVEKLREYLNSNPGHRWVKISYYRGDGETWEHTTPFVSNVYLDELAKRYGPLSDRQEFVIEDHVEGTEIGYDCFTVDGQYADYGLFGIEIKDMGFVARTRKYSELPSQIHDVYDTMAPTLKEGNCRSFFSFEIRVRDDGRPVLIDPCFSKDTEILTNQGWKFFPDLDGSEMVATMDPKTRWIEYQKPTDYLARRYRGKMILLTTPKKVIECLVTPNHGVWRTDRHGDGLFVERADSLTDQGYIPRVAIWGGVKQKDYVLPEYRHTWRSGKGNILREKYSPEVSIPMKDWLAFLGIYLAEGSLHGKWGVNVSQRKHRPAVRKILKQLPFNVTESKGNFVIHSVQLASHLRQFGLCHEKFVPDYVKLLSSDLIDVFLSAYHLGDGTTHKPKKRHYIAQRSWLTTSKKMADDLQELIMKCGGVASIYTQQVAGTRMRVGSGKWYTRNYDMYCVSESVNNVNCWFATAPSQRKKHFKEVDYDGMVYDVTVPNHTVYVRRNGKPFWSSNCARQGSPTSEAWIEMYSNFSEVVWEGAAGNLVQPIPVATWCVIAMIESQWAIHNWTPLDIPAKNRKWVKLRNACRIDNKDYFVPQSFVEMPEVGGVVGIGKTYDEAAEMCKEIAKSIKGYDCVVQVKSLDESMQLMEEAGKKINIDFIN